MDNRVYYGEYSLKHWINLVLKQNIVLPEYQRYFVWNENKVKTLIETFKNKQFIPPVTIGAYKDNGNNINLILDGQQRDTSILLVYLGLYPDVKAYKSIIEKFANDNDNEDEDDEELEELDNILEWNLNKLTEKGNNKETIRQKIISGNYKNIDFDIDDNFLETNFLGFSYLVPHSENEKDQQKYYSSVFRNINIQGEPLLPEESRASLYFLDQDLKDFFSPSFTKKIVVKLLNNPTKIDFVRYLSLLSQYHYTQATWKVARGYKPKMEKFYEEYIYSAISNEKSDTYGKFIDIFPNKQFENELLNLENTLRELDLFKEYPSVIDLDVYLFGLIYQIVFQKKNIKFSSKDDLIHELEAKIHIFKQGSSHTKSPNNLGYLRNRIDSSIEIYEKYINHES